MAGFTFMCTRNPANQKYCLSSLIDAATNTAAVVAAGVGTIDACYFFSDSLGCCAKSLFDYYGALGLDFGDMNATLNFCGLGSMPACPAANTYRKIIKTRLHIEGTDWTWFNAAVANKQAFVAALRADLAAAWGVDPAYITFTNFLSGSVIADAQVIGDNDTATSDSFTSISAATSIPLTNLQATTTTSLTATQQPATMKSYYISAGSSSSKSNVGAIVGGVIGGMLAVGIVIVLTIVILKRKNAGAHVAH